MAKVKKAQMGYRVRGEGRSCGIERQMRKDERQSEREWRKIDRQGTREVKREERQAKREERKAPKSMKNGGKTPAWQRKEGKNPSGGLNAKGVASYRKANPGSKLKTAVTTKPSKLKPGSKAANRRKSFCARMSGMKKRLTSAKTANDPNSRINKSLRKWHC